MKKIHLQKASAQIARPNTIRDINRQIVLNYVRDQAPISRADISRKTNLQRSTVSAIIDSLQKSGLIESIGVGNSTGGRKPTLLRIKTGVPVAIGVDLAPRKTTIAVADLSGKVLDKISFITTNDLEDMISKIIQVLKKFIKKYKKHKLEVGMSLPGITNRADGEAIYVPYFRWSNIKIAEIISSSVGVAVTVENDANAIALAELWFGREVIRKVRDFVTVLIGEGIGTGIIMDGQVYSGDTGASGEFGHMIIGSEAQVACSCGSNICWEAFASEIAIKARYNSLAGIGEEEGKAVSIDQIIRLARKKDPHALETLRQTAKYIGIGIANLIIGLSPQAVVVSGEITKVWDLLAEDITKIANRSVRKRLPNPIITASSLKENPTLTGAFSLVLAKKFASAS
jgi:predicted NBD/HSP70 family sugar kinase